MTQVKWDQVGERLYETGVDHGVLYLRDGSGDYTEGYPWNGLTTVTESPSGAESNKQYADNIVYVNLISAEDFGGTIEAFTSPEAFARCDGTASPSAGIYVGQQTRETFGFTYRTLLGNDIAGTDHGYKLHLVYGATASPSEKAYGTVNDSPEALALSWDFSTLPVDVPGLKPSAIIIIDSTKVDATALADLLDILYGTVGADPRLPLPAEIFALFAGTVTQVTPTAPTYVSGTHTLTIPTVTGVIYKDDETGDVLAAGPIVIAKDTVVKAYPAAGYRFPDIADDDWFFDFV